MTHSVNSSAKESLLSFTPTKNRQALLKCLAVSLSKNKFFDRLTEVNKAVKTSNSHSSAYVDTVEGELRSKSNALRSKFFTL